MLVFMVKRLFLWFVILPGILFTLSLLFSISKNCALNNGNAVKTMSIKGIGRQGNIMFQYAALRGLAARTGHRVVLPESFTTISRVFHLEIPISQPVFHNIKFVHHLEHDGYPHANETIGNITLLSNANVLLRGYFESFRYFENINDAIRKEFTLNKQLVAFAHRFFEDNLPTDREITRVGLHVRMGRHDDSGEGWLDIASC